MDIQFYERLVIAKHRLDRVYCHIPDVVKLYMKRWREKNWEEGEERDAKEFLELEKEIFLEMYPCNEIFEDEGEEQEGEGQSDDDVEFIGETRKSKPAAEASKKPAAKAIKKPAGGGSKQEKKRG